MAKEYKEIVTKAVIGKASKSFETNHTVKLDKKPTTILGLWVINHTFSGNRRDNDIDVEGSFDVNIWYSCDDNSSTEVKKDTVSYKETITISSIDNDYDGDTDVIVRSLKGPTCKDAKINGDEINYTIEKTISCEVVGDTKIRVGVLDFEDKEDNVKTLKEEEIKESLNDDFLN